MASLHLRTIEALALAIEAKDHTTHDHLQRVQVYAVEIGKELRLSETTLEALRAAALLHDIGKLAVPEHIISKPGKLTREEFEKMKIHPVVGAEILERVRFPYPVTPIVRSHHERWDGTGYPDGLKGEEIPIGARMLAAVDCLDALASDRQYRRALPLEEAMEKVGAESGIGFDPRVVEILRRRYVELEAMAQARRSGGPSSPPASRSSAGWSRPPDLKTQALRDGTADTAENFLTSIAAARQEVQNLFELAQDLGNSLSLNETLSLLAMRLKRMIPYDSLAIYVLRDDRLRAEYVNGENFRLFSSLEIPLGQGLSGWVAENRKPIVNGNPSVEPGYLDDETKFTTMRSALAVPLIGLNGTVSVLTLYHTERDAFTKDHLRILLAIVPKLALSIENALAFPAGRKFGVHRLHDGAAQRPLAVPASGWGTGALPAIECAAGGAGVRHERLQAGQRQVWALGRQQGAAFRGQKAQGILPRVRLRRSHGRRRVRAGAAGSQAGPVAAKDPAFKGHHGGSGPGYLRAGNVGFEHRAFHVPRGRRGCRSVAERSRPAHVHREAEREIECGRAACRIRI